MRAGADHRQAAGGLASAAGHLQRRGLCAEESGCTACGGSIRGRPQAPTSRHQAQALGSSRQSGQSRPIGRFRWPKSLGRCCPLGWFFPIRSPCPLGWPCRLGWLRPCRRLRLVKWRGAFPGRKASRHRPIARRVRKSSGQSRPTAERPAIWRGRWVSIHWQPSGERRRVWTAPKRIWRQGLVQIGGGSADGRSTVEGWH